MAEVITWKQVETMLARQGISFEKDGVKFKGSAIDRRFSFAGLEKQLSENRAVGTTHSATESLRKGIEKL